MATKTAVRPALTDAQLTELMGLLRGSDTVELKLTIPDGEQRSAMAALGLDPLDAQIRQVFFFDTPDLQLNACGLVVRARRVQKRGDDSVVKLRPVVPSELSDRLRQRLNVEVDAMPGGFVCSGREGGAGDRQRSARRWPASARCASSSPRSSAPCCRPTPPTA